MPHYIVKIITRAHSSGSQNNYYKLFDSLEEASQYIQKQMRIEFQANGWDVEWDPFYFDFKPKPDISKVASLQRLENLIKSLGTLFRVWGPYSSFEAQRPFEIQIAKSL